MNISTLNKALDALPRIRGIDEQELQAIRDVLYYADDMYVYLADDFPNVTWENPPIEIKSLYSSKNQVTTIIEPFKIN